MAQPTEQSRIIELTQRLALAQRGMRELNAALEQVTQQRNQSEALRVNALTWLLAVLLEHHEGEAVITIPLLEELTKAEYQISNFPAKTKEDPAGCIHMKLVATDSQGLAVHKQSSLRAGVEQIVSQKAPDLEVEDQGPAARCDECFLAFGEHRPGCTKAEQRPLPLEEQPA